MKVVIVSGGRGSEKLQEGIREVYGSLIDTTVIICAMDNGLSTGQCRQVYNGELLGPSDLRKNQIIRYSNSKNADISLLNFFQIRFTVPNEEVEAYVQSEIGKIAHPCRKLFSDAAENFFNQTLSKVITYHDFSIANLIYAGLAGMNNNSLSDAGKVMANVLEIPDDAVLVASDKIAYINASTVSGVVLSDEVDIDEWDNADDRISELFFTDQHGKKISAPVINADTHNALVKADIIIFSTGTQWTSLIPTYSMTGFKDALRISKAAKYLVMNNENDLDTVGYTAGEIQELLGRWLPMDSITTVFNKHSSVLMSSSTRSEKYPLYIDEYLSEKQSRSHSGWALITSVFKNYFGSAITNVNGLLLDYDDTIVGRNNTYARESAINKRELKFLLDKFTSFMAIVTGNSIRTIDNFSSNLKVYADCGLNEYMSTIRFSDSFNPSISFTKMGPVDKSFLLTNEEVETIKETISSCGIDMSKITNKAYASIAIKPIVPEYREAIRQLICHKLPDGLEVNVVLAGTTTIEIHKCGLDKTLAVVKHLDETNIADNILVVDGSAKVVYLGDEGFGGNDECIRRLAKDDNRLYFLPVKNPRDTAIYLLTLSGRSINGWTLNAFERFNTQVIGS